MVLVAAWGRSFADTPAIVQSVVRAITLTASDARGRWEASSGWGGGAERFTNSERDGEVAGVDVERKCSLKCSLSPLSPHNLRLSLPRAR